MGQNMSEFLEFLKIVDMFKAGKKTPYIRSFPKKLKENSQWFNEYSQSMMYKIQLDLERVKPFDIDDRTKRAMLMTNIPKDKDVLKTLRLPYPVVFLNLDITTHDEEIEYGKRVIGCMISEQYIRKDDWCFFVFFALYHEDGFTLEHFKISFTDVAKNMDYASKTTRIRSVLKRLIVNTILFINEPDIELVHKKRSEKSRQKRIKQGKYPLPDSVFIKLTGKIKRYFDNEGSQFDGDGYSHKFRVRGSWRHFRSEKFTKIHSMSEKELEESGYRLKGMFPARWIPPFVKGKGVLIEKTYKLRKEKSENEIDMQDIKPLDKPLRKLKEEEEMKKWRRKKKREKEAMKSL